MADVDAPTFDAILLDCHAFYLGLYAFLPYMYATQHIVTEECLRETAPLSGRVP